MAGFIVVLEGLQKYFEAQRIGDIILQVIVEKHSLYEMRGVIYEKETKRFLAGVWPFYH